MLGLIFNFTVHLSAIDCGLHVMMQLERRALSTESIGGWDQIGATPKHELHLQVLSAFQRRLSCI